jgi:hypothetical protein
MSARSLDFPAVFARVWVDSSIQMLRATTELWTSLLDAAPSRSASSTASPWWMPPQQPLLTAPAAAAGAWTAPWAQALAAPSLPSPAANAYFPWLASLGAASGGNPFAAWQQMWLQSAMPAVRLPWLPAEATTPPDAWQPIATAYRTANGHAMAAVLRTMANVVEPKPSDFTPAHFWPAMLGTRH